MNCPNCGSPQTQDQNFCRSCGLSLQAIPPAHAKNVRAIVSNERPPVIIDERQPFHVLAMWGFLLTFVGVAIGVVGKMLLHQDIVTVVGVLASLAGMLLTAYPFIRPPRPQRYDIGLSTVPGAMSPAEPTKKLSPVNDIDFIPSVTEGTTELLKVPAARSADQDK